ncbi:MAG TPA: T9SS type A sorting domain-containing protein, partial [Ignavibacteriaceae bacterium]|nr:T9SS type A sorting domain-containing protein [Ignavibacteriaceae bacterium]
TNANVSFDTLQTINIISKKGNEINELFQNYPNPFNPSTTISFSLPKECIVKLKVFNLLGEEVKTILNVFMEAGYHSAAVDLTQFPSGMYFYKLESGEFSAVKKMILAK